MHIFSLDKKTLLLLGGLLILCFLLLGVAFSLFVPSSSQNAPQSSPSTLQILSFSPKGDALLQPGKPGAFSVTFNNVVLLENILVSLSQYSIPTEKTKPVPISLSLKQSGTVLYITSTIPLQAYASYTLTLSQKSPLKQLFSQTYQVDYPIPTPLPKNNLMLQKYLPYKTNTYELSYLKNQNIYVFNFIYDFNNPTNGDTQFENAKQNALDYIRSKGIDPNTVTIEWRYH